MNPDLTRSSLLSHPLRSRMASFKPRRPAAGTLAAAMALVALLSVVLALLPAPGEGRSAAALDSDAALAAAALAGEFSALSASALTRETERLQARAAPPARVASQ
jgi:hypothetical protein